MNLDFMYVESKEKGKTICSDCTNAIKTLKF